MSDPNKPELSCEGYDALQEFQGPAISPSDANRENTNRNPVTIDDAAKASAVVGGIVGAVTPLGPAAIVAGAVSGYAMRHLLNQRKKKPSDDSNFDLERELEEMSPAMLKCLLDMVSFAPEDLEIIKRVILKRVGLLSGDEKHGFEAVLDSHSLLDL